MSQSQSLEQFLAEMRQDLVDFEKSYRKSHEENPEHFPLTLDGDNTGLWLEFFVDHVSQPRAPD